ncbi:MAG: ABC transporter substrate-binding protein [Archaeoglobaceae archaeon]
MKWQKVAVFSAGVVVSLLLYSLFFWQSDSLGREIKLGLGVEFNTHATPIWVAVHTGLFEKHGITVETLLKFRTGADLASALARGDVDLGVACLGPIVNLVDREVDVKIVGKVHNRGYALVVNPERIRSLSDLNNTTVYSTGIPNPTNILLLKIKDLYGLEFNIKPIGDPNTVLSMLISGQIDSATLPEHYSSVAEERGLRILVRDKDVWPNMPGSFVIARGDILKNNPEVVAKFVNIIKSSVRIIEENRSFASHACALELGISDQTALRSIEQLDWDTELNITEIQEYIDFMFAHGLIEKKINASDIVVNLR